MAVRIFTDLPDSARLWIYGAIAAPSSAQIEALEHHMERFLAEWQSHGREVSPSWQMLYERFVAIGVDEAAVGLSGCSIDSMARAVNDFSRLSGVNFSNSGGEVFFRGSDGAIQCVDRFAFGDLVRQGAVDQNTIVFDNTIGTLADFRVGRWEVPMRQSWHMDVFGKYLKSA